MRSFLLFLIPVLILGGCNGRGAADGVSPSCSYPFVLDSLETKLGLTEYSPRMRCGDRFFLWYKCDSFLPDSLKDIDFNDLAGTLYGHNWSLSSMARYLVDCDTMARISDISLSRENSRYVFLMSPFTGTEGLACDLHEDVNSSFRISEKVFPSGRDSVCFETVLRFFEVNRLVRQDFYTIADTRTWSGYDVRNGSSLTVSGVRRPGLRFYRPDSISGRKQAMVTSFVVADGYTYGCHVGGELLDFSETSTYPVIIGFICTIL